ncbi:MAG: SUMF1/EgtB/PvdO family nonheme iron enzyme, partial [Planctomycetota bacterium]
LAPGGDGGEGDMFAEGFVAKILDLGLSKNIGSSEQSYLTQTGTALGTPHYISPEQARGDKRIDGRTDIYSLGATLYHLVTGQTPFSGTTAGVVIAKHLSEQLPNPQDIRDDLPDGVVQIIQKMMAKEAGDRYANCAELLADLELASQGKQPSSVDLDPALTTIALRQRGAQAKGAGRPRAARPGPAVVRKKAEPGPLEPLAPLDATLLRKDAGRGKSEPRRSEPRPLGSGPLADARGSESPPGTRQHVGRPSGSPGKPPARPTVKYITIGAAAFGLLVLIAALAMSGKTETPNSKSETGASTETTRPDARTQIPDGGTAKVEPAVAKAEALPKEMSLDLGGGVKMEFVLVPAGEFMMGSDDGGPEEKPVHKVKISQPYYIGKYDVTVEQFRAFADATQFQTEAEKCKKGFSIKGNGWEEQDGINWRNPGFKQEDNHPVVVVTWNDAQAFCRWATKLAGRAVRLPMEAEWEYAARGPKIPKYPWGDKWEGIMANVADASLRRTGFNMRWGDFKEDDGYPFTSPCGAYKNASWCGAFDMAGNVWQWCQDYFNFNDTYYAHSPWVDPKGPGSGKERVLRGGCWFSTPGGCRAALRGRHGPFYGSADLGFRVALELPGGGAPVAALPETTIRKPETPTAPPPADVAAYAKANGLEPTLSLDLGGGVKMDMVLIPAGEFMMGSEDGPPEEKPVHKVKISKPFYMGKYHVTVAQFRAFVDAAKFWTEAEKAGEAWSWKDGNCQGVKGASWRTPGFLQADNFPACVITWYDAQEFCKWAAKKMGSNVCLPTEAQWEYACRAGTTTRYNTGDKDSDLEQAGWFNKNSGQHINPVGQKKPNAWGLYDMHGNVWQWVQDYFDGKYYAELLSVDPKGSAIGGDRVLRGGCWDDNPDFCRAAHRRRCIPAYRDINNGFRCALDF